VIHLAIRGYAGTVKLFEDCVSFEEEALDTLISDLAEKHAEAMARHDLHMVEIEFLDEPNRDERFFRFGTDPSLMVSPVEVKLGAQN
jgi:hypothetical protein